MLFIAYINIPDWDPGFALAELSMPCLGKLNPEKTSGSGSQCHSQLFNSHAGFQDPSPGPSATITGVSATYSGGNK